MIVFAKSLAWNSVARGRMRICRRHWGFMPRGLSVASDPGVTVHGCTVKGRLGMDASETFEVPWTKNVERHRTDPYVSEA